MASPCKKSSSFVLVQTGTLSIINLQIVHVLKFATHFYKQASTWSSTLENKILRVGCHDAIGVFINYRIHLQTRVKSAGSRENPAIYQNEKFPEIWFSWDIWDNWYLIFKIFKFWYSKNDYLFGLEMTFISNLTPKNKHFIVI